MGKARARRLRGRREYLSQLAKTNPDKFQREWAKRLESWSEVVVQQAGRLTCRDGRAVPSVFSYVEQALEELESYGEQAVQLEGDNTREVLQHFCCESFAQKSDPRMYRITNSYANYLRMTEGFHKPCR